MAQRLTDTSKWDEDWFLDLPPKMKCVVHWLDFNRDGAGIQPISFNKLSSLIKEPINRTEFDQYFGDRYLWLADGRRVWDIEYLEREMKKFGATNRAHLNIAKMAIRELENELIPERGVEILKKLRKMIGEPDGPRSDSSRTPDGNRPEVITEVIRKERKQTGKESNSEGGLGETNLWNTEAEILFQAARKFGKDDEAMNWLGSDDRRTLVREIGGMKFVRSLKDDDFSVRRLAKLLRLNAENMANRKAGE